MKQMIIFPFLFLGFSAQAFATTATGGESVIRLEGIEGELQQEHRRALVAQMASLRAAYTSSPVQIMALSSLAKAYELEAQAE